MSMLLIGRSQTQELLGWASESESEWGRIREEEEKKKNPLS